MGLKNSLTPLKKSVIGLKTPPGEPLSFCGLRPGKVALIAGGGRAGGGLPGEGLSPFCGGPGGKIGPGVVGLSPFGRGRGDGVPAGGAGGPAGVAGRSAGGAGLLLFGEKPGGGETEG